MFKPGTLFIIGAGANEEIGMPLGGTLVADIARSLYFEFDVFSKLQKGGDYHLFNHIRRLAQASSQPINDYLEAARLFHNGLPLAGSIDEYLGRHGDKPFHAPLGKLAIMHHLISAERKSKLFCEDRCDSGRIVKAGENTWLAEFVRQLFMGRVATDLDNLFDDISIISFNYDRCLQHYLAAAVEQAYHVSAQKALQVVARLEIICPYGTLGSLMPSGGEYLPFGADVTNSDVTWRIQNIRTFSEHFDDELQKEKIRALVSQARCIVFLGFGFHPQNIDLLRCTKRSDPVVPMFATGFGLSQPNIHNIVGRLKGLRPDNVIAPVVEREIKAAKLLADYRMVLAA